jgi:cation transport ATPase
VLTSALLVVYICGLPSSGKFSPPAESNIWVSLIVLTFCMSGSGLAVARKAGSASLSACGALSCFLQVPILLGLVATTLLLTASANANAYVWLAMTVLVIVLSWTGGAMGALLNRRARRIQKIH